MSTLHPMFEAVSQNWYRNGGAETENIRHGASIKGAWQQSPLRHMIEERAFEFRRQLEKPDCALDFPVLEEFKDRGGTDYLALMTTFSGDPDDLEQADGMIVSWTSDREGGFSAKDVEALRRLQRRFSLSLKIAQREQVAENVVSAYLGADAGKRVLAGQIRRGDGQNIHAVIWFCDLRDSTVLADKLPRAEFLSILNDFFDCMAGAVLAHGGEVLRFIGDAALAIFPTDIDDESGSLLRSPASCCSSEEACQAAVAAANEAMDRMAALNQGRAEKDEPPLEYGLALHMGDVTYGNIGVPGRLEFTVIGAAANEAARLEGLCKKLKVPALISEEFKRCFPGPLVSLGVHSFRGVETAQEVFTIPMAQS
ncbi:MAG: adenylate/guanylate cyclase domain-containing protein [Rhodospirillales bacterium]|nr:adenylate/guanylate cyclase domain-containing protein [Rhodospirillales bacterium]MDP6841009.1 adenylate/guanylate cyclase domain-containing protein [Rhodospirillales bacterium]